ncbi:MAG: biotin transporter BioY [Spirochaetota bacterium]
MQPIALRTPKTLSLPGQKTLIILKRVGMALFFAGLTGACARLRVYLPFSPVPVTGQVFAVLLSGVILGKKYGPLSQLFYICFGILGVPWFAVGAVGPTGGYLVGFVVAPCLIAMLLEKKQKPGLIWPIMSMMAGVFVIYLFGVVQFAMFTHQAIINSLKLAVLPFIPFDLVKALAAASVAGLFGKSGLPGKGGS